MMFIFLLYHKAAPPLQFIIDFLEFWKIPLSSNQVFFYEGMFSTWPKKKTRICCCKFFVVTKIFNNSKEKSFREYFVTVLQKF